MTPTPLHGLDGPPGPKAVPGSPGTGAAASGKSSAEQSVLVVSWYLRKVLGKLFQGPLRLHVLSSTFLLFAVVAFFVTC